MADPLAFTKNDPPKKKKDYHGICRYERKGGGEKSIHIEITFEEALRLSLAIQAALLRLNTYNRREKKGKEMGLRLSVMVDEKAISVNEMHVKPTT